MADYPLTPQLWPDSRQSENTSEEVFYSEDGTLVVVYRFFHVEHFDFAPVHLLTAAELDAHLAHYRGDWNNNFNFTSQLDGVTYSTRYVAKPTFQWEGPGLFSMRPRLIQVG